MQLPTLPTDNLYKFLAFTGLVILFVPTLYLEARVDELQVKTAELSVEVDYLEKQNLGTDQIEIERKLAVLKVLTKQVHENIHRLWLSLILGGLLSIYGMRAWYVHVQIPSDRILKRKAGGDENGDT